LGAGDLVMLAIGAVIGAGIFSSIGTAAAGEVRPDGEVIRAAAGPALILSFIAVVLVDLVIIRGQSSDWSGLPLDFVQNAVVLFLWCNIYFGGTQWQAARHLRRFGRCAQESFDDAIF